MMRAVMHVMTARRSACNIACFGATKDGGLPVVVIVGAANRLLPVLTIQNSSPARLPCGLAATLSGWDWGGQHLRWLFPQRTEGRFLRIVRHLRIVRQAAR